MNKIQIIFGLHCICIYSIVINPNGNELEQSQQILMGLNGSKNMKKKKKMNTFRSHTCDNATAEFSGTCICIFKKEILINRE